MTLFVLAMIAPIGAIDVLYYHLFRFRLFEREQSVAEEITHLMRHLTFVALVALLSRGVCDGWTDAAVITLFAIDLVNSSADVLLEPRSRQALGGLPAGEYFLHFLGTFGVAIATATYFFERASLPIAPAEGWPALQSTLMIASGLGLFALEAGLFVRALRARAKRLVPASA
ncbi:MAG: hypothetical protein H6721_08580 [Sandaracinus sp.]|nr:hypothetical protein [Myxococcales bacterium]MCB9603112.1 hypothetical protein [Sandaracinus sp.]MCB9613341.1 hypothetical protein [Sandaracinus sp.]MCB9632172.1 hypothetical protein [Sandaracinus sp.]